MLVERGKSMKAATLLVLVVGVVSCTMPDSYSVTHFARGDLLSFKLERTATFCRGVLTFNKPVKEYLPAKPYTRFDLLETPCRRFVSQAMVRDRIIKGQVSWERLDRTYALSKEAPKPKQ
jgi:hypothetical protein